MKHYLYLTTAIIGTMLVKAGNVQAQDCIQSRDCAALGYTESSCSGENGGVKCPFGDKWACYPEPDNPVSCEVGTLYYSDGKCYDEYIDFKKLLGIVIYSNGASGGGWVMTHEPVASDIVWSTENIDIPGLTNITSSSNLTDIQASCTNTDKITAQGNSSKYPAAWAAKNYKEGGKTWCLPSGGLLRKALNNSENFTKFNAAVYKIRASAGTSAATILGNVAGGYEYVWSSSEDSSNYAWIFSASGTRDSFRMSNYYKFYYNNYLSVRPVMEF